MEISEICCPSVVTARPETTITEASRLMRQHHVGDLVVTVNRDGFPVPVGIVTDRDIVVEVVATELDPKVITIGDIMGPSLVLVEARETVASAIRLMCLKGVRRLPVVGEHGELVGILSEDDLLVDLSDQLTQISKVVTRQRAKETWARGTPAA